MADLHIEEHSPTWRAVKAWAEQRIETQRKVLESPYLGQAETEHARGAIRDLRLLLALPAQKPNMPTHSAAAE